ncbi:MAG: UDP-3-O-(3-hydroxymyristoyl)glucosamine N-acyltransferase [Burkholderiales bacterium]|nr:UDP-3-O-(3-hydroxymyristoyl)glucosamine N-acyltransferase [Burkholderiales bacterium]
MSPTLASGITLADLARRVAARLDGDGSVVVRRIGALDDAASDSITFLADSRLRGQLAATRAAAVIVAPADAALTGLPKLVHARPYVVYAKVAAILHADVPVAAGIDATARIGDGAIVDATASIDAYAVVGARARVGARVVLGPGACIGDDAEIGDDTRIGPNATIYARCVLGPRCIVHAGAVIGADGFGMAEEDGRWLKIPQIGRVLIGADCEIGANTTIDRGAIGDTVLEDDVKLDNQVQVGHNCRIGAHTAVAGCAGIAGSVSIGRNCKIGGAVGIIGHLTIADGTVLSAATSVMGSIREPGVYTGMFPAMPHRDWRHVASQLRRLRELSERIAALEREPRQRPAADGDGA